MATKTFLSVPSDNKVYLGFDIGSVSLNTVIMNSDKTVLSEYYDFVHGKPFHVLKERLAQVLAEISPHQVTDIAFTGSGGKLATSLAGGVFVNEIIAQATSTAALYPDSRTVIEIGGEDSKLILLDKDPVTGLTHLVDFEMNSICAAGTGSFLDQQAKRIGVAIENEFGQLALMSVDPPRIAGRCSVFAKSDMIHHQQIATPLHDIVAGLCFALARNFRSNIARGRELHKPVIFSGGVAANAGMVRAFRETLNLAGGELIIPAHHSAMGAIGAVMYAISNNLFTKKLPELKQLNDYLQNNDKNFISLPALKESDAGYNKYVTPLPCDTVTEVYLGLDIGSLSTNVVLIDAHNNVVARRYLPTAGKPLEAIRKGMSEIFEEKGQYIKVAGAGTTGSGRYLTGDFIGADIIVNEITAQATAAIDYDSTVDTIFEIGGQDSKYISIENGVVVDFEMNKVCAAGTGSFLEEQAEKLNINIIEEFGHLAMESQKPLKLGDRCTVFMESDLISFMQRGAENKDLVGGLAYSIVYNYLQKVVGDRRIGNKIFFQGGVTNNKAVVAAFEQVLGKKIIIPPHFDVTGAIGAAIIAKKAMQTNRETTKFKGFGVCKADYKLSRFVCNGCTNHCEIRRVIINGADKPLFYGGRCEKYETDSRKKSENSLPNLFNLRTELLLSGYEEKSGGNTLKIGIPRALMIFYQQFPFWNTFLRKLGFSVILSRESDKEIVSRSIETITAETCLPVELMHGHVIDLLERGADYVFIPFIINGKEKPGNKTLNCNCPWIQTYPFMVKAALRGKVDESKLLVPSLHFRFFETALVKELCDFFSKKFGIDTSLIREAVYEADRIQTRFESNLVVEGKKILGNIPSGCRPVIVLGRPYNSTDEHLNLALTEKLIAKNVLPIPLDMIDLSGYNIFPNYRNMYWPNGQKLIAAAQHVARTDNLYAVYISNFRCGPDSFIWHYISEELKAKPFLHLEVDEHSADAGMITRIEAFLDSLEGFEKNARKDPVIIRPRPGQAAPRKDRVMYFPYMNDGAYMIAAAARSCDIASEVLPRQNATDLAIGRKYTSSRECFPMICTTGSFLKKLTEPGADPSKMSFFMPDHNGPCRFGQYNQFHRILFDKLGFNEAELITPSNDTSYADVAGEHSRRFRINAWKGFIAADFLRKIHRETRPYEIVKGDADIVYEESLRKLERCIENGTKGLHNLLEEITARFMIVKTGRIVRRPIVAIIGEIFMRDNIVCNGDLSNRLESLGLELVIAPFSEWITYSTYRFTRDSRWRNDLKGIIRSKIQGYGQEIIASMLLRGVEKYVDTSMNVSLHELLNLCNGYVNEFYDGDPPVALGTSVALSRRGISGIAAILPFTCMPGTLVASVSDSFRKDHNDIPFINVAWDGQDSVSLETRLQAFAFQVKEFATRNHKEFISRR